MLLDPRNMNPDAMEEELMKMWGMISELSDQMQNNRHLANTLQNQASQLRVRDTLVPARFSYSHSGRSYMILGSSVACGLWFCSAQVQCGLVEG